MPGKDTKGLKILAYIIITAYALCCVIPFLLIIAISFTDNAAIKEFGYSLIPKQFSAEAYRMLIESPKTVVDAYKVNIIVTVFGTFFNVVLGVQYAYMLVRKQFRLRNVLSFYMFFTMLFSGGMVPSYILITQYLGWKNNMLALIVPYLVTPYNIFLVRSFMASIPDSLYEAAKIDGAGEYRILYTIIYPMSTGAIATVTVFAMLSFWNAWYPSMLYMSDATKYSLQYMLQCVLGRIDSLKEAANAGATVDQEIPEDSLRMATCVLAAGPLVVAFPFFQKYFVKGVMIGSIKE